MTESINVLDHGYVKVIEAWGSDERIVEAARMSTDKGFLGWGPIKVCEACGIDWSNRNSKECDGTRRMFGTECQSHLVWIEKPGDEKLLKFLYTHKHMTPFEMGGLIIEVQAPIFVFREWHRHRTQSYNELSARYTPLPDVNYVPTIERLMMRGGPNKQASSTGAALTEEHAMMFQGSLITAYEYAQDLYQGALKDGVPKELARLCIPVGRYSRMRASANLRCWLMFLTLRTDSAAQYEIREYANVVAVILRRLFPRTMELFDESLA